MDDTLKASQVAEKTEAGTTKERLPAHDHLQPSSIEHPIKTENLELLMDVAMHITVELGRRDMRFAEILRLGKGSIVELSKLADDPVDIYVNQSKVAEGEVVVVDEHFGVRITKLLNTDRINRAR
ncbi:MAG TPA: flagellar motor switch protein FliN [bacterium]